MSDETFTIISAPLQGYTEAWYRLAHASCVGGVDEYAAPFVRLEHGAPRPRDRRDLAPEANPPRIIPQILAAAPEELQTLTVWLTGLGYHDIDLNFGCPFAQVTGRGYGCGILAEPKRAADLLAATEKFPAVRFSVKMRLGLQRPDEWCALLDSLNSAPLRRIVLHPRTGAMGYRGTPDREAFAAFRKGCTHPVLFNGDLTDAAAVEELRRQFPDLPGVMLGRGLLANPELALELRSPDRRSPERIVRMHREILNLLRGEETALMKLHTLWEYLLPHADRRLRRKILKSRTLGEYRVYADELFSTLA